MIQTYKTPKIFGLSHHQTKQGNIWKKSGISGHNPQAAHDVELGKAIYKRTRALRKLAIGIGVFSMFFLVGIPTGFFKPLYQQEVDMLCEFRDLDAVPDIDPVRNQDESPIRKYCSTGTYELAIDFGLKNFKELTCNDKVLFANAYQKLGRIDKSIIVYESLSQTCPLRLRDFVEYKLAYLYTANYDEKGLGLLEQIMDDPEHTYHDEACKLYRFNPIQLLSSGLNKNRF
jgi:hypothetical protein